MRGVAGGVGSWAARWGVQAGQGCGGEFVRWCGRSAARGSVGVRQMKKVSVWNSTLGPCHHYHPSPTTISHVIPEYPELNGSSDARTHAGEFSIQASPPKAVHTTTPVTTTFDRLHDTGYSTHWAAMGPPVGWAFCHRLPLERRSCSHQPTTTSGEAARQRLPPLPPCFPSPQKARCVAIFLPR